MYESNKNIIPVLYKSINAINKKCVNNVLKIKLICNKTKINNKNKYTKIIKQ